MGRYPNSKIHEMYSDWHYKLISIDSKYKKLYVADIDRLWIEYDFLSKSIVAVVDIKWEESGDLLTPTEKGIYEWFRKNGVVVFTVYITPDFARFRVIDSDSKEYLLTPIQYADWLLQIHETKAREAIRLGVS